MVQETDGSAIETLKSMMNTLESQGYEDVPDGINSEMLDNSLEWLQSLIDDLDPADRAQFREFMGNSSLEPLNPNDTAETINAIADGALDPASPDYNRTANQVNGFLETVNNNIGEGTDAKRALGDLPENSLVRKVTDPLFDAANAQQTKIEGMLGKLDGYNDRVKAGREAVTSGDRGQMEAYLKQYTGASDADLAGKDDAQIKEMVNNDIENVGYLAESEQIRLQQAMALLQILYSTAAGVVDSIKQATNRAANAVGS
jgi:hypothetical protein